MDIPRKLSVSKASPFYNLDACRAVDKVYVDGVHIPNCVAYDMDAGWAFGKSDAWSWLPKVRGTVTVTTR